MPFAPFMVPIPVAGTLKHGVSVVAVADLDDQWSVILSKHKVKSHTLGANLSGDLEGDSDAFRANPI
jgi:hypothetical protein